MASLLPILVAFGVALSPFPALARGEWLSACATDRLVYSWIHQGYGRTDEIYDPPRHPTGNQLRYVGKVRASKRAYRIYFDQGSDPQTQHGHQDVIVLTSGGKFLGFYEVNDTQLEPLRTKGADILFEPFEDDPNNRDGARIHFGTNGPPQKIVLNGHDLSFATPADFPKYFRNVGPWPEPRRRLADYCHKR